MPHRAGHTLCIYAGPVDAQVRRLCEQRGARDVRLTLSVHLVRTHTETDKSSRSVDLHCNLADTTAATCTGSSSFGSNYHHGTVRGPTHTVWTSTFSGPSAVVWAALTLATPGPGQGTTNIDGTVVPLATSSAAGTGAGAASDARAGCRPARGGVVLSVGVVAVVGGLWGW